MSVNMIVVVPSGAVAVTGGRSSWTRVSISSTAVVSATPKDSSLATGIDRCQWTMRQCAPSSRKTRVVRVMIDGIPSTTMSARPMTQPTVASFQATVSSGSKWIGGISENCTRIMAAIASGPTHHSSGAVPMTIEPG